MRVIAVLKMRIWNLANLFHRSVLFRLTKLVQLVPLVYLVQLVQLLEQEQE